MSQFSLRPYQLDAIERMRINVRAGQKRIILCAPTGAGKTILACEIIRAAVEKGKRALFISHQRKLITQSGDKLARYGVPHGLLMAGHEWDWRQPVVVASRDTLFSRAMHRKVMQLPPADVVVSDECHSSLSNRYQAVFKAYPRAVFIGLSATPARSDGRGLGEWWETIVPVATPKELIRDGYLVPLRIYAPTEADLSGVKTRGGDYVESELGKKLESQPQLIGDAVTHWLRLGENRPTVAFCTKVSHSLAVRDAFHAAGVESAHIDANTPDEEREEIFADLRYGRIKVLCNVNVCTEGWDEPIVSCAIMLRPTRHPGRWVQAAGRIVRSHPGKTDAILIDHTGTARRLGYPEDIDEWPLETSERIHDIVARKREKSQRETIVCPNCHAVREFGGVCVSCGYQYQPKGKSVQTKDGTLEEFTREQAKLCRNTSKSEKERFWEQCIGWAIGTNAKTGAAAHRYKQKFGKWPSHGFGKMPRGKQQWNMPAREWYQQFVSGTAG